MGAKAVGNYAIRIKMQKNWKSYCCSWCWWCITFCNKRS
jgi:hypothetical protein